MLISVVAVVVSFNRRDLLISAVNSLLNQTYEIKRIIIIDNASSDGTAEAVAVEFYNSKKIEFIQLAENIGGAGGFNYGISKASFYDPDFIWVFDDDAEPSPNCLSILLNVVGRQDSVVAVAPAVKGLDGLPQLLHRGVVGTLLVPNIQHPIKSQEYNEDKLIEIEIASFVGLLFRGSALKEIALPRADFFIYNDDVEFSLRLKSIGSMLLVPKAEIIHKDNPRLIRKKALGFLSYLHIPPSKLGFLYLNRRNLVWTARQHIFPRWKTNLFLLLGFSRDIGKILLVGDSVVIQIIIMYIAYCDGLCGRLGPVPGSIVKLIEKLERQ